MVSTHCIASRLALPVFATLLTAITTTAPVAQPRDGASFPRSEEPLAHEAPVGHRQPRGSDLQGHDSARDAVRLQREQDFDKRLQICRGC